MGKVEFLTFAGLFGIVGFSQAGTLEELKQLLNTEAVQIDIAITGDYLYTADRNDSVNGTSGYQDAFGYNAFVGIYKEATDKDPIGFGLGVGNEYYPVVGKEPLPSDDNQFKIHEAYVSFKTQYATIEAGRILTNIGGEAPFTWQNINIQRGLVWNGEPLFYNGVRLSTQIERFNVYAGVNDRDTSDGKMALEFGASASLNGYIDASLNALIPDSADDNPTRVYNLTLNISYLPAIPLTFYVDYLDTPQNNGDDINSWGAALLGEYKFNNKLSVGGRVEYVNNDGDGDNYGIGTGNNAWTFTITPKYQIGKYLYIRGEASYVKLSNDYYKKDTNSLKDNEIRLGAEIGFVF